jgi:DNA-binding response OmpR family regulator
MKAGPINKLLLVDDDQAMVFGYRTEMELEGFEVDSAFTFEQAEQLINGNTYQAVVTDLNLSGKMDLEGLKVIKAARKNQPQSTVIIVSGISDEVVKKRALSCGAQRYLEKPVEARYIIALLRTREI